MAPGRGAGRGAIALLVASLLAGCSTRPLVTVRDAPPNHAWWLRAVFDPRSDSLRGIPVRAIRDDWCAIDELAPRHFEPFERAHGGGRPDSVATYSLAGPWVDGRPTRLVLAAFRGCAGGTGTAMLLLDAAGQRSTRAIAVDVIASPARYAMLAAASATRMHVVFCQECDVVDAYEWDAGARRFALVPVGEAP